MKNIIYTFNNIKKFNKDILDINVFQIKFISYGDNQLKIIFYNILTNTQEFELLEILRQQ